MNTTANQISKLISTSNPSASYITHALSELGGGNMQNGLKRMVEYFAKESAGCMRIGRLQGGAIGFCGAAVIIGIIYAYQKWRESETMSVEAERNAVLEAFQEDTPDPTEE